MVRHRRRFGLRARIREAVYAFVDPDRFYDADTAAMDWAKRCGDNAGKLDAANERIEELEKRLNEPTDEDIQRLVERHYGKAAVDA